MKFTAIVALIGATEAKRHHHHQHKQHLAQGVNVPQPYGSADATFVPYKKEAEQVVATQEKQEAENVKTIETIHEEAKESTAAKMSRIRKDRIKQSFGGMVYNNNLQTQADEVEELSTMTDSALVSSLQSTLNAALTAEARDDKAAAVAKTAAIKNIQKALTARILKRLDDGQPLVEVARKMKAIEGMQPQINDMERRLGIMQSVEPVLENAIKTLQKVVDVRGMGKKWVNEWTIVSAIFKNILPRKCKFPRCYQVIDIY